MKKKTGFFMAVSLLFITGLSMLLYPFLGNLWNERRSRDLIQNYEEQTAEVSKEDTSKWFAMAEVYNQSLDEKDVPDAFAEITEEEDEAYKKQLAFREDGVMGYIEIPKISVDLPIYHTTGEKALEKGAGHLQGSSLPVGGEGTHCVISAHRGLPSAAMFTDLDQLKKGDHFYLHVLDRVLAYEVDEIQTVLPEETESLRRAEGKDLVTLVTCTPYGVNTHRLLVRGHRTEYEEEVKKLESQETESSLHTRYGLWVAGGIGFTVVFAAVFYFLSGRKKTKKKELSK